MAALLPIKPLDGAGGYLRWKESVLLRLHTVGVADVLSDDPPSRKERDAAKKWARDDAICRGHILATLSDRLLPDYVRYTTATALWEAVARTYDLAWNPMRLEPMFDRFLKLQFEEDSDLLEQIAHAEALAATKEDPLSDRKVARLICKKLPEDMESLVSLYKTNGGMDMDRVWEMARIREETRINKTEESSDEEQDVNADHRFRHIVVRPKGWLVS